MTAVDLCRWANSWLRPRHKVRIERNGDGIDVYYMEFSPYWFAIGIGKSVIESQFENMAEWNANRIVWC